jgi:hypothetical protein
MQAITLLENNMKILESWTSPCFTNFMRAPPMPSLAQDMEETSRSLAQVTCICYPGYIHSYLSSISYSPAVQDFSYRSFYTIKKK